MTLDENNNSSWENLTMALFIAALFIVAFNAYQLQMAVGMAQTIQPWAAYNSGNSGEALTGSATKTVTSSQNLADAPDIIPRGVPAVYGKELGVSFDDVSAATPQKTEAAIQKLGALDDKITLSGEDKQRYIAIAGSISCEYCCGASAIINKNGDAACGCAHSYAMRGLAKYLIRNHGSEYSNDEILEELGKWKTLFFPGAITAKASVLQQQGIELNYINLASNKYRGIESKAAAGSGAGMVGGC
ncbi:hypothetical protein HY772_06640 [Candidatus Woesearchaeota archaeon]|nr:hypothetical protein [Candidatus Woesearchaeota archaeon]